MKIQSNKIAGLLIIIFLVFLVILSFLSEGTYGGADDMTHYRLSRYSFQYPELLLNHWGKPVFTALSSPFSQFGHNGTKIFNILAGLTAAFLSFIIAKKLNYKNDFLVIIFVVFSPIFTIMMLSGMTEILFSLLVILTVYFVFSEKYIISAIVLSFLPFVRTEGVVIIPVFVAGYIFYEKYKAIPFVALGFIFYSIVGSFYYDDFLWVINKMPYTGTDLYGSGSLLHFVSKTNDIFGYPLTLIMIIGSSVIFIATIKSLLKKDFFQTSYFKELLFIFAPMIIYFSAHSYVWWKGSGNSLGLIRVMAGIVPLFALLSLRGLNFAEDLLSKKIDKLFSKKIENLLFKKAEKLISKKTLKFALIIIYTTFIIIMPFRQYKIPVPLGNDLKLIKETSEWIKNSKYSEEKIYYYDPFFFRFLEINPYDSERMQEKLPDKNRPEQDVKINNIVIWDAHFSPNEGQLPLVSLMENPFYKLLKIFSPEKEFTTLGGYNYEIYIFQRIKEEQNEENTKILEGLQFKENDNYTNKVLQYFNFENRVFTKDSVHYTNNLSHNGKKSLYINKSKKYYSSYKIKFKDIKATNASKILASMYVYTTEKLNENSLILAVSFSHDGEIYFYRSSIFNDTDYKLDTWNKLLLNIKMPEIKSDEDEIKFFIWNKNTDEIYIDDFLIEALIQK